MTLVVALACKDGVILAADGQSAGVAYELERTFGMAYPASKINHLGDKILWGGSGSAGIIQTLEEGFEELQKEADNISLHDPNLQLRLKEIHSACVRPEIDSQKKYGISSTELIGAQLLFVANDVEYHNPIKIWCIGSLGHSIFLEEDGIGIIGDATLFANMSLLNFRRNLIWYKPKSKSLSTEQGCLVAYRAVKDAIEASLDRVGPPIDIWTIKNNQKPTQVSGQAMKKLEEAYVMWKEAEIIKLQELL
jgi:20S proteasome alpha/beta subunit